MSRRTTEQLAIAVEVAKAESHEQVLEHGRPEYVCWTRMQAEAGQPLERIIKRKEQERRLGGGVFLWGVGNAPALITNVLARAGVPVRIIFSVMKSKPKDADIAPRSTVVWRSYVDANGAERPLPAHALVTSRGDSTLSMKRVHYALMCRSDEELVLRRGERFDPSAFRNAGESGGPVGASQEVHSGHMGYSSRR
jgi:hypothetical protein